MAQIFSIRIAVPDADAEPTAATVKTNVTSNLTSLGFTSNAVCEAVMVKDFTAVPTSVSASFDAGQNY